MNVPHSQEAEQSILGCILSDNAVLPDVAHNVTVNDFYNIQHKKIYEAIITLYNDSKPVDIVTVSNAGIDIEYLTNLMSLVMTTANIKHYISILKGKAIRRQYIHAGQKIIDMAYNGEYDNVLDFKNDVLQTVDIEIKDAKNKESHIKHVFSNVLNNMEARRNSQGNVYKKYGFKWIDTWTNGIRPSLTYLAARPSVGKTTFALNIATNLVHQGLKVAMFNLEMDQEQLAERLISIESQLQYEKVLKPWHMDDNDWTKLSKSLKLAENDIYIFDTVFKIEEIKSICRELKSKGQLDYVIVDYLQLCETMKKTGTPNERVSHISRQFKIMQKELKVPFLVLSQLNRANEADKRKPKLTDLRESGSLEQDADNVFFLHDPSAGEYVEEAEGHVKVEFIIAKQRAGRRDIYTELKFYKNTQKFYDN